MDKAEYALKLAEGKLNLGINNKNLEMEQMRLKILEIMQGCFFGIVMSSC